MFGWTGNCPCFAAAIALRRVRPHVNQSYILLCLFTVMTQYLDLRCVLLSIRPRHAPYQESSILYSALHGWLFIMGHLSTGHLSIGHLSWVYMIPARLVPGAKHVSNPACSVHRIFTPNDLFYRYGGNGFQRHAVGYYRVMDQIGATSECGICFVRPQPLVPAPQPCCFTLSV